MQTIALYRETTTLTPLSTVSEIYFIYKYKQNSGKHNLQEALVAKKADNINFIDQHIFIRLKRRKSYNLDISNETSNKVIEKKQKK